MASTSQIVEWIALECHGWNQLGTRGILPLLNEAHTLLNTGRREQDMVLQNGNLPYLATRSGVYSYTVSGVWTVENVLIDRDSTWDYETLQHEDYSLGGQDYYRILNIRSDPWKASDQNARVTFFNLDPGTTTQLFRTLGYRLPTQILSIRTQHDMPPGTDMMYLAPATMALIDAIDDHAKSMQARDYILHVLKPRYQGELDKGAQGQPMFVTPRPF